MTPSRSQISLANIVQTVQYRFEYIPPKSQKINSHIIQNVFYTQRIILKQYKMSREKREIDRSDQFLCRWGKMEWL